MELKEALKEQYHATAAMLADCVRLCPAELWTAGTYPRTFDKIALHGAFYTQLYLCQEHADFAPWPGSPPEYAHLWDLEGDDEPYDMPQTTRALTQEETLAYITFVDGLLDSAIDSLDLTREDTGFSWYKEMSKMSHVLMNLRHTQGHIGQLSELLMAAGVDTPWRGKLRKPGG
jgi:hypothetical protein